MKQHILNRILFVSAAGAVLGLGLSVGMAVAHSMPPSDTVRILKIGAALEQSGAVDAHFSECAALIEAGRIEQAEAYASNLRAQRNQ